MSNAASKSLMLAMFSAVMAACNSADPNEAAANNLVTQIDSILDAADYQQAMALIDSLDANYPDQIEARRKALSMRPKAIEGLTIAKIAEADSIIAFTQAKIQELEPLMRHVSGGELDGYYVVAKAFNPSFINSTGIEARVNDSDKRFYIVAQSTGREIGLNQVALESADGTILTDVVPANSERIIRFAGSEMVTFIPEECDSVGSWAAAHPVTGAELVGAKGRYRIRLNPAQMSSFATAWQYSDAHLRNRSALILREKLERRLQKARDQAANHPAPED